MALAKPSPASKACAEGTVNHAALFPIGTYSLTWARRLCRFAFPFEVKWEAMGISHHVLDGEAIGAEISRRKM